MAILTYSQMVKGMTENDASLDGSYYVGVHSTGIYCLPSCRAKLPLLKNVVFYATREEAISARLRGCKRCKSEQFPAVLPDWLMTIVQKMNENRSDKLSESMLSEWAGVNSSTIRRYFKEHLNTTALSFHRKLRLNHARRLIESGQSYLSAGYECGFESSSGFRDAFVKQFGFPPGSVDVGR